MPVQHSPLQDRQDLRRAQAVLTTTPRAPLDGTPEVSKLRAHLDRGPSPGEGREEEEGDSVEEEEFDGTEYDPDPVGYSQGTGGPALAQYNQPVSLESEPSLLDIMKQMTQIMANLKESSSSEESRPQAFKNPSMKAPE
ncbi:hypothetical protein O181_065422 [Austropuccinia psidii MF-1]|uniref:Uncharacterized protein n=1 Tax=Austropuccinia psidii MF-1 TaxID=1389203 RepID=A0A9Q3EXE2_9BASI|nr:hypothetical protein [Austropuccinia psidii MF-1]